MRLEVLYALAPVAIWLYHRLNVWLEAHSPYPETKYTPWSCTGMAILGCCFFAKGAWKHIKSLDVDPDERAKWLMSLKDPSHPSASS